jgi:ppGpp synthetase/RelA/SpoT-type nucleotidyltranferase
MVQSKKTDKLPDRKKLQQSYTDYYPDYEAYLSKISRKIRNLVNRSRINATIQHRVKSFDSYFDKILRNKTSNRDKISINDMMGVRIVCPFLEHLDSVERIISRNFKVLEVERKGLKHSFREFGYDSIHMLIDASDQSFRGTIPHCRTVCEIQLRSILQEAWAEVEHELIYKANVSLFNDPVKRKLASLNAILTLSDVIFQEIRDYQKQIQQEGLKLRETLHEKVQTDEISILTQLDDPVLNGINYDLTMPIQPKSGLEKLLLEALSAHSNNQFETAIKIYSRILRMRTNAVTRSIVYNHRGMAYFVLSEYPKSISDFSRAFKNDTNNFRALNNRGLTYRIQGNYQKALDDLNLSIEISNLQIDGYYIRALVLNDIQDHARALQDCEQVLNLNPGFKPAQKLKQIVSSKLFI